MEQKELIKIIPQNCCYEKIEAHSRLNEIAEYYNKGWKPDNGETRYVIARPYRMEQYIVFDVDKEINGVYAYFKNREDAQAVIDNTEMRKILNTIS